MGTILLRRGTAAQWASANPILAAGEPGYAIDTGVFKMGNGVAHWADLEDLSVAGPVGPTGPAGPIGPVGPSGGSGSGTGSTLGIDTDGSPYFIPDPYAVYSLGVPNYSRRFMASSLTDGAVTTWVDRGSALVNLAKDTTVNGTVTKITDSTTQYVRMSTGTAGNARMGETPVSTFGAKTVAAVIRVPLPATGAVVYPVSGYGVRLSRSSGGAVQITNNTGGGGFVLINGWGVAWAFVLFHVSAPLIRLNGTEASSPTGSWGAGTSGQLSTLAAYQSSIPAQVDLAELVVWDYLLSANERAAVHTAFRAHYPFLP